MRFLFLCVFFCISFTTCWAGEYIGTMKEVNGDVRIERNGKYIKAIVETQLFMGDIIHTGKDSSAGFSFLDGTRISMGKYSEMVLTSFIFQPRKKKYAFDAFFRKGTAVYSSGKLSKLAPEKVHFRTPKSVVGIRGTKILVKVQ